MREKLEEARLDSRRSRSFSRFVAGSLLGLGSSFGSKSALTPGTLEVYGAYN